MAPAPAGFSTGVYSVILTDADLPPALNSGTRSAILGTWEMSAEPNGHALVRLNGV